MEIRVSCEKKLEEHLVALTETIGERSVAVSENMDRTVAYIESFYKGIDVRAKRQSCEFRGNTVHNVVAEIVSSADSPKRYLIGAHYDSVEGTVGADDNASAIAVQLETARALKRMADRNELKASAVFVSFALEEPPAYGTRHMGSRVYARNARRTKERIDGMICLEMVGYTCHEPGCQQYPFPLQFLGYPKQGDFIGIVGNWGGGAFTKPLFEAFRKNRALPVVKLNVPFKGRLIPAVRLSDHASFWDEGYDAVMVTDTAFFRNPYYHTRSDTMDKLDFLFMARLVDSLSDFFRTR